MCKGVDENTLWNLNSVSSALTQNMKNSTPHCQTRIHVPVCRASWINYKMEKIIRKGSNLYIWLTNLLCTAQENKDFYKAIYCF